MRAKFVPFVVGSRHKTKRQYMVDLGSALGHFSGKNAFQVLRQAFPRKRVFRSQQRTYAFSLTGPGCRVSLNCLRGLPKQWNLGRADASTAHVYNSWLLEAQDDWRRICREIIAEGTWPEELLGHLRVFLQEDEVNFQFHMCELSKAINFVESGNVIYLRSRAFR